MTPTSLVWLFNGNAMMPLVVPTILHESLQRTTSSDGTVTFDTIAQVEVSEMQFESDQHGIQRTFSNQNSIGHELRQDVVLFPVGKVNGVVEAVSEADRTFRDSQSLLFKTQVQNSGLRYPKGKGVTLHGYAEVVPDEDGRFEIPAMLNGRMTLYDRQGRNETTRIAFPDRITVRPNETTEVAGHVISTVLVRGTVIKRDTREPIPNLAITVRHGRESGLSRELSVHAKTDAEGQFEARVFPGIIGYSSLTVVDGYVQVYRWEQESRNSIRTPGPTFSQFRTERASLNCQRWKWSLL